MAEIALVLVWVLLVFNLGFIVGCWFATGRRR